MKLLIGVDDSPYSEAAVEFMRTMQWPKDTHAIVVSSVARLVPISPELMAAVPMEDLLSETRKQVEALVERYERKLRNDSLRVEVRILTGDPRATLIELAKDERVDLIIVGSHGRTGLEKLLMGSVASHVVNHAPCSTLVVKRR
jgi:nucleotide-binding universal stress UspA family protein